MYGDKDRRCPKLMNHQKDVMCRNYGHICCKSCEGYHPKTPLQTTESSSQKTPANPKQQHRLLEPETVFQRETQTKPARPESKIKFFRLQHPTSSDSTNNEMGTLQNKPQNKHIRTKPQIESIQQHPHFNSQPPNNAGKSKLQSKSIHPKPITFFDPDPIQKLLLSEPKKTTKATQPKTQNKPQIKKSSNTNNIVTSRRTWSIQPRITQQQGSRLRFAAPGSVSFLIGAPTPNVKALHIQFKPKPSSSGQNFRQNIPVSNSRHGNVPDEQRRKLFNRMALILSRISSVLRG
ncbi:hypothetical protein FSP39_011780 [Pinctada imbricata]|uniref:Uncharacterized protein n=1 Tax=Pinctada imbricata TaxID=66713 RepID=A0AA89C683_PINIB|nr:hypothetical protein FSP39_011780 [Pinctada imbricata]